MGLVVLLVVGLLALFKAFYIKVPQGTALIVNDMSSTPKVHFTGALVYPVIHLKEFMRISLITLEVDRRGKDGLICRDNMRGTSPLPSTCGSTRPRTTCSRWPRPSASTVLPTVRR